MRSYNVNEVERFLRLTRSTIRSLVNAGFVKPERGTRREYRFSFRDLIVLRTARALIDAKVPRKRIHRSLEDLRRHLPEAMPLCGLSICAVGDRVVVRDGQTHWQAENGQYLLGLETLENGVLHLVERSHSATSKPHRRVAGKSNTGKTPSHDIDETNTRSADEWFAEALEL